MLPEFSITTRDLPGVHIVELHGELDIASVAGLAEALVQIAGSTLWSTYRVSPLWIPAVSEPWS